jgi:hypothetical protein
MSSKSNKLMNPHTEPTPIKQPETLMIDASNPVPLVAKGLSESKKLTWGKIHV